MWLILTLLSITQLIFSMPQYQYHHNIQKEHQLQQQKTYNKEEQQRHQYNNRPAIASGLTATPTSPFYRHYFPETNKCHDNESGRQLFIGDFFTRAGQCIRVQCLGTLEIWEDRCQIPKLNENDDERNCSRLPVANEYLDYPRCCPLYECHSFRHNKNSETDKRQIYDHMGNLIREHITQRILIVLDAQLMDNIDRMRSVGRIPETQFHIS